MIIITNTETNKTVQLDAEAYKQLVISAMIRADQLEDVGAERGPLVHASVEIAFEALK